MTRRIALTMMGNGFGMVGLAHLLAAGGPPSSSLGPEVPQFAPRAKRVIFLFLNGGPSHVDTFDPKPMLEKYHGTWIQNDQSDPDKLIPYVRSHTSVPEQRRELDLLGKVNRLQLERQGPAAELEATIQAMETAFRMQTEAVDAFDIAKESEVTRAAYGEGHFARGCLMARRLVERGVRIVQVYFGAQAPWDDHFDILHHRTLAQQSDQPIAALLRDLKD